MSRTSAYLAALVGVICVGFILNLLLFAPTRTLRSDVLQGILIGFGLAFVTAQIYARIKATRVNGWITMFGLGEPGNGLLLRAAHAQLFPGPVNVPQEAMYWWTIVDGAGHTLSGAHAYRLHFPPGGLPPNQAFWSLTMGTAHNHFVPNPIKRYSVSDRSGLAPNPDGSVDIYIQHTAPAGHESNWLPAPEGKFILWLRVYIPGEAILRGAYTSAAGGRGAMMPMEYVHWLLFGGVCAATWLLVLYSWPRMLMFVYKRAILVKGFGDGAIPVNTLYTEPQNLFADPLGAQTASSSNLMTVGVNHDTLATVGWLNLAQGPQVLHVPDMADRYYSVQFTDPAKNTNFAYVGKRTTGTTAGDYLVSGPGWQGEVPPGIAQIAAPNNAVLVLGRVLVESDKDLPTAHGLAKQIQLTPLNQYHAPR